MISVRVTVVYIKQMSKKVSESESIIFTMSGSCLFNLFLMAAFPFIPLKFRVTLI